jgi:leucine dehydrogenase
LFYDPRKGEKIMILFDYMEKYDYEQLILCQDKNSGLQAIIVIHDTTLGPALGGARMWAYTSEEAALKDALRLARGMTYKNAAAGLALGGGKAVIIGDPTKDKNEALLRAFGRFVQNLNGRYITAEDVGMTVKDMDIVYQETRYVTGVSLELGSSGDPSPATAYGVYWGMKAAAKEVFGADSLRGRTIAIQGVGNVGFHLCKHLHEEGANMIVTDIHQQQVNKAMQAFGAAAVKVDEIYDVDCDIFAPCALGAILNDETIARLRCKIVAGSANNQLEEERHGELLHEKGIIYAPDYVINAGGAIHVADELNGYNRARALKKVEGIYDHILTVFEIARHDQIPSSKAADRMVEERIASVRRSQRDKGVEVVYG